MIDDIFNKCREVLDELHRVTNPPATVLVAPNYPAAFNRFIELLNLVEAYSQVQLGSKSFSEEEVAKTLLIKEINLLDNKKALEPLRIHLWQLGEFCRDLKSELNLAYASRYQSLYLDTITDVEDVISAYEYVWNVAKYQRELDKFKRGRGPEPQEPVRRPNTTGRNPFISHFNRGEVIAALFWLEQCPSIDKLSFRDMRPHAAILGRQYLELLWHDVIGFKRVVDDNGLQMNKFTQVGWKFISSHKTKDKDSKISEGLAGKWKITLPVPINVVDCINSWCNTFTHDPFINMIHVQYYVVEQLRRLRIPATHKGTITLKHGDIHVEGVRAMRMAFEEFVIGQEGRAKVEWYPENYDEGAFIDDLGEVPSREHLKSLRLQRISQSIRSSWKSFFSNLWAYFKIFFSKREEGSACHNDGLAE